MKLKKIFVSYSHADEDIADELMKSISTLLPNAFTFFKAKNGANLPINSIEFGNWFEIIKSEISTSDIVIGILSPDYLNSKWCFTEIGGALLFDTNVIPICLYPIDKHSMPSPFNMVQGFNYTRDDLSQLLRNLSILSLGEIVELSAFQVSEPAIDYSHINNAINVIQAIDGIDQIMTFLKNRQIMGDYLVALFSNYAASIYLDSEIDSDRYGNCLLTRTTTIVPTQPMAHWYYELYIDEVGMIDVLNISNSNTQMPLSYIVHEKGPKHIRLSILFDAIVPKGGSITILTQVKAENYFSDFIKKGLAQIYYNNVRNTKIKKYHQVIRFPNEPNFKKLRGYVINAGSAKDMYTEITPTTGDLHTSLEVMFTSKKGFTDRILIELKK